MNKNPYEGRLSVVIFCKPITIIVASHRDCLSRIHSCNSWYRTTRSQPLIGNGARCNVRPAIINSICNSSVYIITKMGSKKVQAINRSLENSISCVITSADIQVDTFKHHNFAVYSRCPTSRFVCIERNIGLWGFQRRYSRWQWCREGWYLRWQRHKFRFYEVGLVVRNGRHSWIQGF